jgi:hypothetical protein
LLTDTVALLRATAFTHRPREEDLLAELFPKQLQLGI